MSITPIDYISEVKNNDDILIAIKKSPQINEIVNTNLKLYSIIDVTKAMSQLSTVGDLLKVANAASRGYPSSVSIIEILSNYQSLINECDITCSSFVDNCITCLGYYRFALSFIEKGKSDKSLLIIGKAAEKAKVMAAKSEDLVKKTNELVELSLKALEKSSDDQIGEVKKFNDNQKKKTDLENEAVSLRSEIESLNEQITELKELADKAEEDAKEDRLLSNILKLLGGSTKPKSNLSDESSGSSTNGQEKSADNIINEEEGKEDLTDDPKDDSATKVIKKQKRLKKEKKEKQDELEKKETEEKELEEKEKGGSITDQEKTKKENLKKEITTLKEAISNLEKNISNVSSEIANELKESAEKSEDKAKQYRSIKYQYQDLRRNTNADLAENLQKVKNLVEQNYNIDLGIKSLQIVITSMGKIKTIFENQRIFWTTVEEHCKNLSNISKLTILNKLVKPERPNNLIKFENEVKKSGLNWLSLSYVNLQALNEIIIIKKGVDNIMNNLPNKEQAKAIVKKSTDEIQKKLDEENKEIDEIKKKIQGSNT